MFHNSNSMYLNQAAVLLQSSFQCNTTAAFPRSVITAKPL